ncbi:MAG: hypothetical protein AAF236_11460, partial [Verrucomicrobiota bacterium]
MRLTQQRMIQNGASLFVLDVSRLDFTKRERKMRARDRRRQRRGNVQQSAPHWPWVSEEEFFAREGVKPQMREKLVRDAWRRLAAVHEADASVLADLLLLLLEVPILEARYLEPIERGLSQLGKGEPVDVRPWLCDRGIIREMLDSWRRFLPESLAQLVGEKMLHPDLAKRLRRAFDEGLVPDVWSLLRYGRTIEVDEISWNQHQVRKALPFLLVGDFEDVIAAADWIIANDKPQADATAQPDFGAILYRLTFYNAVDWIALARAFDDAEIGF